MDYSEWTVEDLVEEFNKLAEIKDNEAAIMNELAHRLHCVKLLQGARSRNDGVFILNFELRKQFGEPDIYGNEPKLILSAEP